MEVAVGQESSGEQVGDVDDAVGHLTTIARKCTVVLIDAIALKIREGNVANRPVYVALGITVDGQRDVLGLGVGSSGGEGAKQWVNMLPVRTTDALGVWQMGFCVTPPDD